MFGIKKSKDGSGKNEWFDVWPKGEAAKNMDESLNRIIETAEAKDMDVVETVIQGSRFVHVFSNEEAVTALVNEIGTDSCSYRAANQGRVASYKAALREKKKNG